MVLVCIYLLCILYCAYDDVTCVLVCVSVCVACGGFFNSTVGTVSSPALSVTNYHHNINCTYHIMVQANRVMDLK